MIITSEMVELVNYKVPKDRERNNTLFDLSGTAHDELVFTRWYEYFLDKDAKHGLYDLFLQTLLSITGKKIHITDFRVGKNIQTKKGNYLDLLIYGQGSDEGKSIIIENKIHHWLHNDLLDYWDDTPGPDSNKLGILLTLDQHPIPNSVQGKFVNILHQQWLQAVVNDSASYSLTPEQRVILEHFYNAIMNLSKDLNMNEQVLFFLNNIKTVNDIIKTKQKTTEYILSQLDSAAVQLGLRLGGTRSSYYRTFQIPQAQHIYYTIIFEALLEESQTLWIVLEVNGDGLNQLDKLDLALTEDINDARNKGMKHRSNENSAWVHYLSNLYTVDRDNMSNLAEFIVRKINEDFSEITSKAVAVLNSERSPD